MGWGERGRDSSPIIVYTLLYVLLLVLRNERSVTDEYAARWEQGGVSRLRGEWVGERETRFKSELRWEIVRGAWEGLSW